MTAPKKKILVCGATGFIGRNIAEALAVYEHYEVHGTYFAKKPWTNPKVVMHFADLTKKEDVGRIVAGMDIIIQAAATTSGAKDIVTKPYYHVTDNALMNSLLFCAAHEKRVSHIIFFSCTVMYQSRPEPLQETDFNANDEIYDKYFGVGWTKVYIEKMCEFYARLGTTKYTVIRHSNIYGPHDKFDLEKSHVFGATVTKVLTAKDNKITVWGGGEEARDLLYISDLVDFVKKALEKQRSSFSLYNVGAGYAVSIKDLIKKIIFHTGKHVEVCHDLTKPTIKTSLCLNCTKAKEELGWVPFVSLDEGIQKTLKWYASTYGNKGDDDEN
ncbi:NAD(P)-dependent oxidoreductase [Candidatus Woesearchaeota archaeon]|nr:NAD(P)-dependent oxidoreductase [Candidatus Woesearchaeota archaeon]